MSDVKRVTVKSMTSQYLIYALHNDDSPHMYVGKSSRWLYRPRNHGQPCALEKFSHYPVVRWIKALRSRGTDYKITVLEEVSVPEQLDEAERFHIAYLRSLGVSLLNCTDGGGGMLHPSSETLAKMVASKQNVSLETREKISEKARNRSPETKARISAALTGRTMSLEQRQLLSKIRKEMPVAPQLAAMGSGNYWRGRKQSPEHNEKRAAAQRGRKRPSCDVEKSKLAHQKHFAEQYATIALQLVDFLKTNPSSVNKVKIYLKSIGLTLPPRVILQLLKDGHL